jgi:hypothetical protein
MSSLAVRMLSHLAGRSLRRILAPDVDFGRVQFFARELDAGFSEPRKSALRVRIASVDEIAHLLESSHPARDSTGLRKRFQRGDECFAVEDASRRLVHTSWLTTTRGHIPELNMAIVLRPGEAYLYDAYAPPDRRGHGAFGLALDFTFDRLQRAGFTRAYSYVRGDNVLGLIGALRRLRPVGELWYLRVRDRSLVFGGRERVVAVLVSGQDPRGPRRGARELGRAAQQPGWLDALDPGRMEHGDDRHAVHDLA